MFENSFILSSHWPWTAARHSQSVTASSCSHTTLPKHSSFSNTHSIFLRFSLLHKHICVLIFTLDNILFDQYIMVNIKLHFRIFFRKCVRSNTSVWKPDIFLNHSSKKKIKESCMKKSCMREFKLKFAHENLATSRKSSWASVLAGSCKHRAKYAVSWRSEGNGLLLSILG